MSRRRRCCCAIPRRPIPPVIWPRMSRSSPAGPWPSVRWQPCGCTAPWTSSSPAIPPPRSVTTSSGSARRRPALRRRFVAPGPWRWHFSSIDGRSSNSSRRSPSPHWTSAGGGSRASSPRSTGTSETRWEIRWETRRIHRRTPQHRRRAATSSPSSYRGGPRSVTSWTMSASRSTPRCSRPVRSSRTRRATSSSPASRP